MIAPPVDHSNAPRLPLVQTVAPDHIDRAGRCELLHLVNPFGECTCKGFGVDQRFAALDVKEKIRYIGMFGIRCGARDIGPEAAAVSSPHVSEAIAHLPILIPVPVGEE